MANRLPASYSWTPHCSLCRQPVQSGPDERPESWCLFCYFAVGFIDVVMSSVDQTHFIGQFGLRGVLMKSLFFGYLAGCLIGLAVPCSF
jgi:hypothetical protein